MNEPKTTTETISWNDNVEGKKSKEYILSAIFLSAIAIVVIGGVLAFLYFTLFYKAPVKSEVIGQTATSTLIYTMSDKDFRGATLQAFQETSVNQLLLSERITKLECFSTSSTYVPPVIENGVIKELGKCVK